MPTCYYCLQEGHLASHCPLRAQERTSEAIEKLGYQSLQSLGEIVSAQRDITERVVDIGSEISGAIYELADAFKFAHAEEMWYAEKQLEVLTGIREAIEYSETITKANALLEIGVKSLKLDMIEESIEKLQEAVKANPLDYRIYIAMGHAYLRKDDLENALNRFEYALKTARTNYYKSYALLLIARAKYCMGKIEEATKDAKRAVELSPDYAEAHYQYAVYEAQRLQRAIKMSEQEIAIITQSLRKAIEQDKSYFVKAKVDMSFDSIRSNVNALLEEILQETRVKAEQAILKAEGALKDAEDSQAKVYALQEYGAAKAKLVLAMDKFNLGVYNSILEAKPIAMEAYEIANKAKEVALDVREKVTEIGEERNTEKLKMKDKIQKDINMAYIFSIFSILGLIFIIIGVIKWDFGLYLWGAFFGGIGNALLLCSGGGRLFYYGLYCMLYIWVYISSIFYFPSTPRLDIFKI